MQTKETKYIDAAERTLFNHLLGSLNNDCTDFAYYQPNSGRRVTHTDGALYKCCRYRAFNAMSRLNDVLFFSDKNAIIPMLYTNAIYEDSDIKISEETNYPFSDTITFRINGNTNKKFMLRIPNWCDKYTLRINGRECVGEPENNYAVIEKVSDGDIIIISFNTVVKEEEVVIEDKKYAGFSYGSVVLVPDTNVCDDIYNLSVDKCRFKRNMETNYNIEFVELSEKFRLVDYASAAKKHEDDEYTEWVLKS